MMRFDEKASGYEERAQAQRELADWTAEWLEPVWPSGARVLEVGAGTGLLTRHLSVKGPLRAMDQSPAMVREGAARVPGAEWVCSDAWCLEPGSCDRLYSSGMLQWCPAPAEVLANWRAALRPGGRMMHGIFVAPTLSELAGLPGGQAPLVWRTPLQWMRELESAGFQECRCDVRQRVEWYASALDLFRMLHGTGVTPSGPLLGVGAMRRLLRAYEQRHRSAERGVPATWMLMRVEALRK